MQRQRVDGDTREYWAGWGVGGVLVGGTRKKRLNLFCRKSSKGITTVFIEGKVTLGMNKGRVVCEGWGAVAGMQEAKRVGEEVRTGRELELLTNQR